jgi:hypothetical protein
MVELERPPQSEPGLGDLLILREVQEDDGGPDRRERLVAGPHLDVERVHGGLVALQELLPDLVHDRGGQHQVAGPAG